jgi:hypothetical protein
MKPFLAIRRLLVTVLVVAVLPAIARDSAACLAQSDHGESGRKPLARAATSRVPTFDPTKLSRAGELVIDARGKGPGGLDLSAPQFETLTSAIEKVKEVTRKTTDDGEIRKELTSAQRDVLSVVGVSSDFYRLANAYVLPNTHRTPFYVFDIDRVHNKEFKVHSGEPSVYQVDVSIPVKPIYFERTLGGQADYGYTGGWSPVPYSGEQHYRITLDQFAVNRAGKIAVDPTNGQLVPLQMVGPGDWYGWRSDDNRYKYDPATQRYRVAMSLNESSPNIFPAGGHIHCGFIYDFGNPLNMHKICRSGDPSTAGGGYGSTVVVSRDNCGRDN